jgi:ElaB/YqjD/DUF883 family membrane-anchored ribosome-binding protein
LELKEEVAKARWEAKKMMEDLKASRNEAESRLRKELAQERTKLHNETEELLKGARSALKDIASSRKEAAHELRHKLEEGKEEMRSEVKTMQKDLAQGRANRQKEVEGIRDETQKLLSHFRDTLKEVGKVLREGFSEADAERKSSVQDMRQDVRKMQEGFRKEREALKADLRGAAAAWRERFAAKTMEEAPKDASSGEAAVNISPLEEAASEEAKEEEEEKTIEVGAEEESFTEDWKSRILAIVNDHPEGISLADVAERLGVAFVVLGRDSKALLDEGKLRREGKLYFPVSG